MKPIDERGYVHVDKLVSTDWVAARLEDGSIRLVESNEDPLVYPSGHIPGAVEIDWIRDLNDPVRRDYLDAVKFAELVGRLGLTPETTIVFYGDKNNWWATYALWVFALFGFENTKIMDGGSLKWHKEGRPTTREVPSYPSAKVNVSDRNDDHHRAFRDEVLSHVRNSGQFVDVRSPQEFTGERTHMEGYPNEGALRGGHIPGAISVPWAKAISPDSGEFLPADDLHALYSSLNPEEETLVYCRIGERSSHTWFVLKYLLGWDNVRNYDGSWTEWGNMVGVPIER
jgi:thiosulfate/3-mercaptopyruvate sulfurtransferase